MAKRVDRIVVDTNLWISFLIRKDFNKLDERIRKGKVRLVFSVELIDEFLTVAVRPKLHNIRGKAGRTSSQAFVTEQEKLLPIG